VKDKLKIVLIQDQPGSGIRDEYREILQKKEPDIIAFPEYYFVYPGENDEIIATLQKWSSDFDCAILGGSTATEADGKFYNRSYFIAGGKLAGFYDKIHPYKKEGGGLIKKGTEYRVIEFGGLRIGVMICADVLFPDSYSNILGLRPDIIFVPTTSPYREGEPPEVKFARDEKLFVNGARTTRSVIFKVCASGHIGDRRFQARSLIAGQSGIIWRNPPELEDKPALIYADVNELGDKPRLDIEVFRL
jgi:predicted amidohydrolase